ncbi:MAG: phosphatidylserine decarboxylase [Chloroflexi bacterium]|nr:phosphatidylserine decarboxylase [Chloroflexota bacterium]
MPSGLVSVGMAVSMLLMLLAARKWKIPPRLAWTGSAISAFAAALLIAGIYSRCKADRTEAICVLAQVGLSLAIASALILLRFWRDPERVPPVASGVVLSPADGKVVYVKCVDAGLTPLVTKGDRSYLLTELLGVDLVGGSSLVVGVDMNILNVHVNRCPIAGRVRLVKHIAGRFMSLGKEEAPFVNERCTTVIESPTLVVAVVQVASRLVRCVENYLSQDQLVGAGERLGMIRFGSLVAVVLPKKESVQIEVGVGDQVIAGVSIVARYAQPQAGTPK